RQVEPPEVDTPADHRGRGQRPQPGHHTEQQRHHEDERGGRGHRAAQSYYRPGDFQVRVLLMRRRETSRAGAPALGGRAARFEDVPELLRLIERAVEQGCREHYDQAQRRAVVVGYASTMFVDALGPLETVAAEIDGRLVAMGQLDLEGGGLRALFVDSATQG